MANRFPIQRIYGTHLKHLAQEHFTKGCRQLVNQAGNTEIVIADDGFFGIKHLSDLKSNLCLFKRTGKILNPSTTVPIPTVACV